MTSELINGHFHHGPHEAKWVGAAMGIEVRMLAGGEDTGGALTAFEYTAPAGFPGPALHVHHAEDEAFFVVEGTLTVQTGSERRELGPGSFAWEPRGVPHGFGNATEYPVRFFGVVVPGNLEPMLRELSDYFSATAPTLNPARIIEINRKHGIEVVGPPILSAPSP